LTELVHHSTHGSGLLVPISSKFCTLLLPYLEVDAFANEQSM